MSGIFVPWKPTMQIAFVYKYFELIFKSKPRLDDFKFVQNFYFKLLSNWMNLQNTSFYRANNVLNEYIWLNKALLKNNKMLYSNYFIEKGILQIGDIVDHNGKFISFESLCVKYNINHTKHMYYLSVCHCIPKEWKRVLVNAENAILDRNIYIFVDAKYISLSSINFKILYQSCIRDEKFKSAAYWKYTEKFRIAENEWKNI